MSQAAKQRKSGRKALAKAFAHPIRVRAFLLLAQAQLSPTQIAAKMRVPLHLVTYHVRQLRDRFELIELVDERQVRGATEHIYRAIARPMLTDEEWAELSLSERRDVSRFGIQLIMGDAMVAEEAGAFDARIDRHLSRVPLEVDEQGWQELRAINEERLERIMEVQAASAERIANSDDKASFPVVSSTLCFEVPGGTPHF